MLLCKCFLCPGLLELDERSLGPTHTLSRMPRLVEKNHVLLVPTPGLDERSLGQTEVPECPMLAIITQSKAGTLECTHCKELSLVGNN
jgi:hypothetical protein